MPDIVTPLFGICAILWVTVAVPVSAQRPAHENVASNGPHPLEIQSPGISYVILKSGPVTGARPARNSAVRVRFLGQLPDGTEIDRTPPEGKIFPLKAIIPGFQSALLQMRPGDIWRVKIPPELAYGENGPSPVGGKELIFEIELLEAADLPATPPPYLDEMPR